MSTAVQHTVITRGHKVDEGVLFSVKGPAVGREYVLVGRQIVMGRGDFCDIMLKDLNASRKHALLWNENGNYVLKDNRSKNGTYVNGKKIEKKQLKDGDVISIGESVFRFKYGKHNTARSKAEGLSQVSGALKSLAKKSISQKGFHLAIKSEKRFSSALNSLFSRHAAKKPKRQKGGYRTARRPRSSFSRKRFIYLSIIIIGLLAIAPMFSKKQNKATPNTTPVEQTSFKEPVSQKQMAPQQIKKVAINKSARLPLTASEPTVSTSELNQANEVQSKPANIGASRQKYSQAMQAMNAGDYKKARVLFQEAVQLNPNHPSALEKQRQATKNLTTQIRQFYNIGLRDYANLYFDRALQEWEKVLALSKDFDDEYYQKAKSKITEAQLRIEESR